MGINKKAKCIAQEVVPGSTQSYPLDFGSVCRQVMDLDKVAHISDLYDSRDLEYRNRLKTEIENIEGDMFGEEPGTDRYELLQNEADSLIDKLDNYMSGDYNLDPDYD